MIVGVLVLLGGIGAALYLSVFGDEAPPPVSTESAIAACQRVRPEVETVEDLDGRWEIVPNDERTAVEDGSFVGYRVEEELSGIGANTAAGRTRLVRGDLVIEGNEVTEVSVAADLSGLESDDARRDDVVRSSALETDEFPEATFELREPIRIEEIPDDGVTIDATANGDLTLHGVTNPIELTLEAQRLGSVIAVIGSTDVVMTEYGITPPRVGPVLSIDDGGVVEVQLCFTKPADG
jgi:polyisoprenoid-binding protein YceI